MYLRCDICGEDFSASDTAAATMKELKEKKGYPYLCRDCFHPLSFEILNDNCVDSSSYRDARVYARKLWRRGTQHEQIVTIIEDIWGKSIADQIDKLEDSWYYSP